MIVTILQFYNLQKILFKERRGKINTKVYIIILYDL